MLQQFTWQHVHQELTRLAKSRAHLDWEEGSWLVRALRSGVHCHLGFGSFAEYIERLFGYGPRWIEERLRVAEALEKLPEIGQALRDGEITWSTARELTRVAASQNEGEWLQAAKGRTARQIEEMVAGHRPGDGPHDRPDPSLRRHILRMEVSPRCSRPFERQWQSFAVTRANRSTMTQRCFCSLGWRLADRRRKGEPITKWRLRFARVADAGGSEGGASRSK